MSDPIPSKDEMVEAGARILASDEYGSDWDNIPSLARAEYQELTRAILNAVLPLVLGEARDALGHMIEMIDDGMVSEGYVFDDGEPYERGVSDLELTPDGSYRLSDARSAHAAIVALIGEKTDG